MTKCDFCDEHAKYDGKTKLGPWAFMCEQHFIRYGTAVPGLYSILDKSVTTKICCRCNTAKPLSDFYAYNDAHGVHRLRPECKECNLARRKIASLHR